MRQTRPDLEFMAGCLGLRPGVDYEPRGYVLSDKPSLAAAVADGMRDPVANVLARSGILDLVCALPDGERRPGPTPTRGDLEFMADCLGVKVIRGRWQGYPLADEVDLKMADPVANARAQRRIAALRAELPIPYPDGAPPGYYAPVRAERLNSGHVLLS